MNSIGIHRKCSHRRGNPGINREGSDHSNNSISSIYISVLKGLRWVAIATLLIALLSGIYTVTPASPSEIESWLRLPLKYPQLFTTLFAVGAITSDDIMGLRWLVQARTSTPSDSSLNDQEDVILDHVDNHDGEVVALIKETESATTLLDKESVQSIIRMAENDEFDVLGLRRLDRLTRADPWEAMDLLLRLKKCGIIIYTTNYGPYDYNDSQDYRRMNDRVIMSREHVVMILEGQDRGYRDKLKQKIWPFGRNGPACFDVGEDGKMSLTDGAEIVVPKIFAAFLETESPATTTTRINEQLPIGDIESLSKSQINAILENRLFLGEIGRNGEIYRTVEDWKLVDEEDFQRVQKLRNSTSENKRNDDDQDNPEELMDAVNEHARRFGPQFTLLSVISNLYPLCEKCGSKMEHPKGSTGKVNGITAPKFHCTDSDCDETRLIPNHDEYDKIHDLVPLRCPYCVATENFTITPDDSVNSRFDNIFTCQTCERSWGSDIEMNQLRRALNNPELRFSLDSPDPDSRSWTRDNDDQSELGDFTS